MEKKDLKDAAERLASCEAIMRQLFFKLQSPKLCSMEERQHFEEQLRELRLKRTEFKVRADEIRASIPKLSGKRYWWDVPFDETKPLLQEESLMAEAIYTEQGDLEQTLQGDRLVMEPKKSSMPGSLWLELKNQWVPLYMNRAEFAAHLSDPMELRAVYCAKSEIFRAVTGYGLGASWTSPDDEIAGMEYDMSRQMAEIDRELEERLERHNNFWDFMERWEHGSFYTNKQRWLLGQMDTMDYYDEDLFRSARQRDIEHKAWEEQMNLEYQLQRAKDQRKAALYRQMQSRAVRTEQNVIRLMRAAEVIFYKNKLMAIFIPRDKQDLYEVSAGKELNPFQLEGYIYNKKWIGTESPDYLPLFFFLLQTYGERMTAYNVLSACPGGLTDERWRAWAELRWSYGMQKEGM